jgi:N-ethylmaleimide reductase
MLFDSYQLGPITLQNRLVMAPMTRSRATADHVPTPIMAEYYGARADLGLLITEGTAPAPEGTGYARMTALYNEEHVAAWRPVTEAVHARGGRIFLQMMHTGRASAVANLPAGTRVVGPMAVAMDGQIWTDRNGLVPADVPHALTEAELAEVVQQHARAAQLAIQAGFDGVELHAANGYLLEQFLNANVNQRTDSYGGSAEHRNRLVLEIARAVVAAIGAERTGIRLSPYGAFNGTGAYEGMEAQYLTLVQELSALGLVYLHLVNHASMGAPEVPGSFVAQLRTAFRGTFIASGGLDREKAEALLAEGAADLVAFGRPVLANPDFVTRLKEGLPMNAPDPNTFYTPGEQGYNDYPVLATA